jgi:hypothetical protein
MTAADCGSAVIYARERHLWGKRHLSAPPSMSSRKFAVLAGAHSVRDGLSARDVIYGIYARTNAINRAIPTA